MKVDERFGNLVVIEDLGTTNYRRYVIVRCDCGSDPFKVRYSSLTSKNTNSCGCLRITGAKERFTKHGNSSKKEWSIWYNMKKRCLNENHSEYHNYGGRGITYDPKWETFEGFFEDMGQCPDNHELDRINPNGSYFKENCRWVSESVQSHNRRKQSNCTSKYIGVSYSKVMKKWLARLKKNKVYILDKFFDSEEDAAREYDKVSLEQYGDEPNKKLLER